MCEIYDTECILLDFSREIVTNYEKFVYHRDTRVSNLFVIISAISSVKQFFFVLFLSVSFFFIFMFISGENVYYTRYIDWCITSFFPPAHECPVIVYIPF